MAKTQTVTKQKAAPKSKLKGATKPAAPKTLFRFHMTPMGARLRAYTLALITAQIGGVKAGAAFKLWPGANFSGHVAKHNLVKADGKYSLTPEGVSVFTNSTADAMAMVPAMLEAVTTGKAPESFKGAMSPL